MNFLLMNLMKIWMKIFKFWSSFDIEIQQEFKNLLIGFLGFLCFYYFVFLIVIRIEKKNIQKGLRVKFNKEKIGRRG